MRPSRRADGAPRSAPPRTAPAAASSPSDPTPPDAARRPSGPGPATDPTRPLQRWESWVDRAIREAEERGEFANLPGAGKPLALDDDPYAGEWRTAFRVLKNADMAPPWIEANREMVSARAELATLRDRLKRQLAAQPAPTPPVESPASPDTSPPEPNQRRPTARWRSLLFGPPQDRPATTNHPNPHTTEREAERRRARRRYLDRAAALDAKIAEHNALLPDTLRRLEQPRLPSAQAARDFDAACPPVPLAAPPPTRR